MRADDITAIVITYNEEPNLPRTIARLSWLRSVLVVDSFSTDRTLAIARSYPNVQVVQRAFDTFAQQLNYALDLAELKSEWVLVLDADYVLSDALVDELKALEPTPDVTGYRAHFRYCIDGAPLRASLYPPSTVLFRHRAGRYYDDGHAYRVRLPQGRIAELRGRIDHDDRKPITRWLASQTRYAAQEADKLTAASFRELRWPDRIRKVPLLAPIVVLPYCLVAKRCALDGRAGAIYTAQRAVAEFVLALHLFERAPKRGPAVRE